MVRFWAVLELVSYNVIVLIMVVSHMRCMCTNPGLANEHLDSELIEVMRWEYHRVVEESKQRASTPGYEVFPLRRARKWWCQRCNTYKPKQTHHCSTCRCCVLEMDHHCPWVNNCVGWRNHKYFLLFVVYAWLACLLTVLIFFRAWYYINSRRPELQPIVAIGRNSFRLGGIDSNTNSSKDGQDSRPWDFFWLRMGMVTDFVVCAFMFIFTCVMVCDQWEFMTEGIGVIDKKQLRRNSERDPMGKQDDDLAKARARSGTYCGSCRSCDKLPHVMGEPPGLRWLLPLPPGCSERAIAVVPEDDLIYEARARYGERLRDEDRTSDRHAVVDGSDTQSVGQARIHRRQRGTFAECAIEIDCEAGGRAPHNARTKVEVLDFDVSDSDSSDDF